MTRISAEMKASGMCPTTRILARHYLPNGLSIAVLRTGRIHEYFYDVVRFDGEDNCITEWCGLMTEEDAREEANILWVEMTGPRNAVRRAW